MYYIFKTQMVQWQGVNLQAEMQSDLPLEWRRQHDWWASVSLKGLVPTLTFSIHSEAPRIDNYFTGNQFSLYSERLISILHQTGVQYETFPVSIIDQETREAIEHKYRLFHLLEIDPAIDTGKSIIEESPFSTRGATEILKLVLTDTFMRQGKALTRIKERRNLTVIHEDVKNLLDEAKITGCSFMPVEDFSLGMSSLLRNLRNRGSSRDQMPHE